ncbi:MAG TPA: transglutaminase, partial [Chryseobacterium indologenes]|nr:transglutaminase [Chryseobacterium indologenes]
MKRIILITICFATTAFNAQKYEFLTPPKFSEADLSKPKSLLDENAPAEILYKSVHFTVDNISGELHKIFYYRVKIYDKDKAEDWLNLEIPLYSNKTNRESL